MANRVTDKLTQISDRIFCCRSGSAADTQAIADYVKYYLSMHAIEMGAQPEVKTSASIFQQLCYNNRENLTAGIICAGWDKVNGGSVYTIPMGGMCVKQPYSIGGSGSTFLYGFCDSNYREKMTRDECERFIKTAIALAIARDGSSGGVIRLAIIDKDGVERKVVLGNEIPRFYEGN